ncbi:MAG: Fic family protein [Verrucomicrobiota bacterium]
MNWKELSELKQRLDTHRPLDPALVRNLENWFRIELTYTSNALEGNTLTRQETAVVVEKGLTVGGKSLHEHLEANNHAAAYDKVVSLARSRSPLYSIQTILLIHEFILKGIDDANAGIFRSIPVRISGSDVVLPNPHKVPSLMDEFASWLKASRNLHPVELAAEAHFRLVTIHPFVVGNGRTARLIMNFILIRKGYPPAIIRKRDRLRYLRALEQAQLGGSKEPFHRLIFQAVRRSLDIYLNAVTSPLEEDIADASTGPLLRIGALAKKTGETTATLRHWTKEGLLRVASTTPAGYQLFSSEMVDRAKTIRDLQQSRRLTLAEIRDHLAINTN